MRTNLLTELFRRRIPFRVIKGRIEIDGDAADLKGRLDEHNAAASQLRRGIRRLRDVRHKTDAPRMTALGANLPF